METKLTPIDRYNITSNDWGQIIVDEDNAGQWVKYDNVSHLLQQRDELLEAIEHVLRVINIGGTSKDNIIRACKNTAEEAKATVINIQKHQI